MTVAGLLVIAACGGGAASGGAVDAAAVRPGGLAVGTNLDGLAYWSPAMPFIDLAKSAGQWLPQRDDAYDTGEAVPRDAAGWVTALPAGAGYRRVHLNVLHDNPAALPGARYVVLYKGQGRLDVAPLGGAEAIERAPGRLLVKPAANGMLGLDISEIDTADPLRDVQVVREDLLALHKSGEIFNPAFVAKIRPFQTLRFMDWMNSNVIFDRDGAPITDEAAQRRAPLLDWRNRSKPQDMRWGEASRGVPVEAMVALANKTRAAPWFNMPINASDDYVRGFATYARDHLKGNGRVHVELSNEVWNFAFPQSRYADARAHETFGPEAKWMEWYGKRAAEVGMIWNEVFGEPVRRGAGGPGRVVVVYNTQLGWRGLEVLGLETERWRDGAGRRVRASDYFDEYAIAGYYDGGMNTAEGAREAMTWWGDADGGYARAIAVMRGRIATFNAPHYAYHARQAAARGLRFVSYEGGYGEFTPISEHRNQAYTDFLVSLQRRPEIYDLEAANLAAFKAAGGSLYMNFGIIGSPSKWGSWAALESIEQATSPRYRALIDTIAANRCAVRSSGANAEKSQKCVDRRQDNAATSGAARRPGDKAIPAPVTG